MKNKNKKIRKNRQKIFKRRRRMLFFKSILVFLNSKKKFFLVSAVVILFFSFMSFGVSWVRGLFVFDDIEIFVVSDNDVVSAQVYDSLLSIENINIFGTASNKIKDIISDKFGYPKNNIVVQKYNTGTILVELIDSAPNLAILTREEFILVDFQNVVVRKLQIEPLKLDFNEEMILKSKMTLEDDYIKVKFLEKFDSEEQKRAVKWQDIPIEDKQSVLQNEVVILKSKIESFVNLSTGVLNSSEFKGLPILVSINESEVLNVNKRILDLLLRITDELLKRDLVIEERKLVDSNSIEFTVKGNKKIIFTIRRDFVEQINDLDNIILNKLFGRWNIFDLRSKNFIVK